MYRDSPLLLYLHSIVSRMLPVIFLSFDDEREGPRTHFSPVEDSMQKESPEISCESVLDGNGWILKSTLTEKECKSMIQLTEKLRYEDAESFCFMYRNRLNDRIMTDDPGLADLLWE